MRNRKQKCTLDTSGVSWFLLGISTPHTHTHTHTTYLCNLVQDCFQRSFFPLTFAGTFHGLQKVSLVFPHFADNVQFDIVLFFARLGLHIFCGVLFNETQVALVTFGTRTALASPKDDIYSLVEWSNMTRLGRGLSSGCRFGCSTRLHIFFLFVKRSLLLTKGTLL